jgi:hypothetical protein
MLLHLQQGLAAAGMSPMAGRGGAFCGARSGVR